MFLTTNTCDGIKDCIKACPTKAIRFLGGKAFSCLTCGICYKTCPNDAISKTVYGGYVVDRNKCNGCGICMHNCPINNISIEGGTVYGICSRCGICVDACPTHSRVDGFKLNYEKQMQFINFLNIQLPTYKPPKVPKKNEVKEVSRVYFGTNINDCIYCGRCESYCPTGAIKVNIDLDEGICRKCKLCVDACPNNSISKQLMINHGTCTTCLSCLKVCPNNAITLDDFEVNINKLNHKSVGSIVSCLNCGLCVQSSLNDSLIVDGGKIRYDPTQDNVDVAQSHKIAIENCPVSTLSENNDLVIFDENTTEEFGALKGFCVSCGLCVSVCEDTHARQMFVRKWDGTINDSCIYCGTCQEVCPTDSIVLDRKTVKVDLDNCILCETCGIYCPTDAIPKSTLDKKVVSEGFNLIDQKQCIKCGLCYEFCQFDAIEEKNNSYKVNEEKCTYCGACANACPANAFLFDRKFKDSREAI